MSSQGKTLSLYKKVTETGGETEENEPAVFPESKTLHQHSPSVIAVKRTCNCPHPRKTRGLYKKVKEREAAGTGSHFFLGQGYYRIDISLLLSPRGLTTSNTGGAQEMRITRNR